MLFLPTQSVQLLFPGARRAATVLLIRRLRRRSSPTRVPVIGCRGCRRRGDRRGGQAKSNVAIRRVLPWSAPLLLGGRRRCVNAEPGLPQRRRSVERTSVWISVVVVVVIGWNDGVERESIGGGRRDHSAGIGADHMIMRIVVGVVVVVVVSVWHNTVWMGMGMGMAHHHVWLWRCTRRRTISWIHFPRSPFRDSLDSGEMLGITNAGNLDHLRSLKELEMKNGAE